MNEDVRKCISLELSLMDMAVRQNPTALDRLLHPDCMEFGNSGRVYDRSTLIELLTSETPQRPPRIFNSAGVLLSDSVCLVTYRSIRADVTVNRMSIWCLTDVGWQLRFHQGTPAEEASS